MRYLTRKQGFTLIEVVIALAVVGILMAVSILALVPAVQRAKVRQATSVIAADLQYAQMIASRERRPIVMIVTTAVQAYMIRDRSGSTIYRTRQLGPSTDYGIETLAVAPATAIEVFPSGVIPQTTTFTVTNDTYQRGVRITRAGHVRILSP
jgi:prepilin-type N-terminal cleavage/methylation domain-containing protein